MTRHPHHASFAANSARTEGGREAPARGGGTGAARAFVPGEDCSVVLLAEVEE